jgi:hypothetical protein
LHYCWFYQLVFGLFIFAAAAIGAYLFAASCSAEHVVQMKGRVACEVTLAHIHDLDTSNRHRFFHRLMPATRCSCASCCSTAFYPA